MFELTIRCSKDIDKLSIDFSDGTVVTQTKEKTSGLSEKAVPGVSAFLDTEYEQHTVSQEVVQLPDINLGKREVSVAPELQNLDI